MCIRDRADTKQADAVAKILAKNSELTPEEALEILSLIHI